MFGTEIVLSNFCITLVEIMILSYLVLSYIAKPKNESKYQMIILTLSFIFYNLISGFLPDNSLPLNLIIQNIISIGAGIWLAIFFYRYLVLELNMHQTKYFNLKNLIISLIITFLFGFVLGSFFNTDVQQLRRNYAIFPSIISIYFCAKTVQYLLKQQKQTDENNTPYILMLKMAYFGILFMATMPIVVLFGDYQTINNTLVNISYFLVFYAYYKHQIYQNKIEHEMVKVLISKASIEQPLQCKSTLPYCLTSKQLEVAYYMFKGLSFKEIAKIMYIQQKTVSKHASNIYRNTKCKNKADLIEKFASDVNEIEKLVLEPSFQ